MAHTAISNIYTSCRMITNATISNLITCSFTISMFAKKIGHCYLNGECVT